MTEVPNRAAEGQSVSTRVSIRTQHEPLASTKAACTHEIDILTLVMGDQGVGDGREKMERCQSCPSCVIRYQLELNSQQDQV